MEGIIITVIDCGNVCLKRERAPAIMVAKPWLVNQALRDQPGQCGLRGGTVEGLN